MFNLSSSSLLPPPTPPNTPKHPPQWTTFSCSSFCAVFCRCSSHLQCRTFPDWTRGMTDGTRCYASVTNFGEEETSWFSRQTSDGLHKHKGRRTIEQDTGDARQDNLRIGFHFIVKLFLQLSPELHAAFSQLIKLVYHITAEWERLASVLSSVITSVDDGCKVTSSTILNAISQKFRWLALPKRRPTTPGLKHPLLEETCTALNHFLMTIIYCWFSSFYCKKQPYHQRIALSYRDWI